MKDIIKLILELADQQINIFLEDGKLKIDAPNGIVLDAVISRIKLRRDEIIEYLSGNEHTRVPEISQAQLSEAYVLSSSQRRLWVLSQFPEGSIAYNIPAVFEFNGILDRMALSAAFESLVDRHEILRTVFRESSSGEIMQYILTTKALNFHINYHDLSKESDAFMKQVIKNSLTKPFDLEEGPLLRADLYYSGDNKWIFSYVMHHIISDGWSMEVLIKELLALYNSYVQGQPNLLSPLRIHYKDYAVWQQQQLKEAISQQHKQYWLRQFSGELPVLELPADKVRPAIKSYNGASLHTQINAGITAGLRALCQSADCTLFMGLLTSVKTLLYRYSGQEDIIIGSPIAGREHPDLEEQIGFYVNTLALRTRFSGTDSYLQLLSRVKQVTLDAYQHQSYPFDELVEALPLQRDMSRSGLFDVLIVLQHQSGSTLVENGFSGLQVRSGDNMYEGSKVDLQFSFTEAAGGGLGLSITYNTDIYSGSTIERLAAHFEQLQLAILSAADQPVQTLNYLGLAEQRQLLETFNDTVVTYAPDKTITDLFEAQWQQVPDHIAIAFENSTLSYRQLDEQSWQLAHYLKQFYNTGTGDLVGIGLERSEWLPLTILSILKTGAAYIPIDITYPQERIDYILKDGHCKVFIDAAELEKFRSVQHTCSTVSDPVNIRPDDVAYCIYTSGSTGTPKGVLNSHGGLYNRLLWMKDYLEVSSKDVFLQKTPYTFDVSVWELLLPFITGSTMVVAAPEKHKDTAWLQDIIADKGITITHFVPSMLGAFLMDAEAGKCGSLKHIVCSGEELPVSMVTACRSKLKGVRIHNLYGPTEAAIDVTAIDLTAVDVEQQGVSIGYPVANTKIYIVNEALQLQPSGIPGELLISGVQVAKGYLHLDELTASRFIDDPFTAGKRVYRTGDVARWLADGRLQYLGRMDDQVKIRGNRIELGEVEKALSAFTGIEQGIVAVKKVNGEKVLVAYYVSTEPIGKIELKQYLQQKLPEYMVPDFYAALSEIPLTASGKSNRKALPGISEEDIIHQPYVAPRNATEEKLVDIWQEILNRAHIGVKDNFFELGGHSLKVTRLVSRIYKVFGVKLILKELFTAATIESQAVIVAQSQQGTYASLPVALQQTDYPLSSSQRRLWVLSQFEEGSVAYNMSALFSFEGSLDLAALPEAFDRLMNRHESLRTVFRQNEQGEVRQHILPVSGVSFKPGRHDLSASDEAAVKQLIQSHISRPFDLSGGPLLRADLYQTGPDTWLFSYVMHHIISDGWSMEVLMKELLILYNACTQNQPDPLIPLRIHYKDYAVWQQQQIKEGGSQQHKVYWQQQFSGELPVLELPGSKLRPAVKTYRGAAKPIYINAGITKGIKDLCQSTGSTLFMGLLAAVKVLFYRYSGQEDIITGSPIAGREHSDLEDQIGFYVNTLALRTRFSGEDNYYELLSRVRQVTLDAYEHQSWPFDELVDELPLRRDMSRSALFDVMVLLQHQSDISLVGKGLSGLNVRACESTQQVSKFDMSFNFAENHDSIGGRIFYNTDIYDDSTITELLTHFYQLLEAIINTPEKAISQLAYLSEAALQTISGFNKPLIATAPITVTAAFARQVRHTPDNKALVYEETALTYRELDEISGKLAAYLQHTYGIKRGDLAGIQLERSEWMIMALWGILKCGAAFVPVDPHYPKERIDYILSDSNCSLVIDETVLSGFRAVSDHYSGDALPETVAVKDLAYVTYTSGSTGRPKGVMIEHGALYSYITAINREYGCTQEDRILQLSNFAFDAAIEQIMLSLLNGATLYVISQALATDTDRLGAYITDNGITHLHTVPTLLQQIDFTRAVQLKRIVSAGESCPLSLVHSVSDNIAFYNKYGPTEATISATLYKVLNKKELHTTVPIGYPLANSRVYILDGQQSIVPPGVRGEIYIGGNSLARGYLRQEALTAEKFISDPYNPGERLYRTGDTGYWQSDGSIVFTGRQDEQVKIRGHRIELGEITSVLEEYPGVTTAVATCTKDGKGDNMLAVYLVGSMALKTADIRGWLGERLPHYMVPAHVIIIDAVPLTSNGKINKEALPRPDVSALTGSAYVAPRTETEKQLVSIWKKVLKLDQVGITDNFFESGGHSLHITRMLYEMNNVFGIKLQMKAVFTSQNIQDLAQSIEDEIVFKNGITTSPLTEIINDKKSEIWEI